MPRGVYPRKNGKKKIKGKPGPKPGFKKKNKETLENSPIIKDDKFEVSLPESTVPLTTKEVVLNFLQKKYSSEEVEELYSNAERTARITGSHGFFTYIEAMCREAGLNYNDLLIAVKKNKEKWNK